MPAKQHIQVDGREIAISNTEKVYYPESKFTKGEVIAFYSDIAATIVPHLRDRPLTLKRYPEGVDKEHFYEKNAPSHTPAWVQRFAVPRSEGDSAINYILCNDKATLIWATNLGDIEKHVLLARAPQLDRPTALVFDLDPGDGVGLLDCGRVALHLRDMFQAWGLESFVKVSGSKGLHLSVPLNGDCVYEVAQPFARAVAELAVQQMPKGVVSEMAKTLRRGKVLIDWSQNSDFKTTVSVYAMRAKHGQPFISMPVTWDELAKAVKRGDDKGLSFTPAQATKRLAKVGDLFEPVLTLQQELPAAFTQALAKGPPPKLSAWPRNEKKSGDRSIREYAAKRDHSQTPEPAARPVAADANRTGVHRFVIQKHQASHLHYDWRLEMQGVLRSWAVPKGPPTELRESRLAMHVEDHPLEYENFEGTIPPGNYGAGTVMVWDRGEYEDVTGNPAAAFHAGKLHLIMRGTKLNGEWILVKDRRAEDNRWLLIKAGTPLPPFSTEVDDCSVVTQRSMSEIATANDAQWQSNRPAVSSARRRRPGLRRQEPDFIEPMHCQAVTALPETDQWTFEIKFDGYRCLAVKRGTDVTLFSRNRNSLNARFHNVVAALREIAGDFVLDGEIVALDERGRPSFQLLQNWRSTEVHAYFYVFDLLNHDGEALLTAPIEVRRQRLGALLPKPADPLRLSAVLVAPADKVLEAARQLGLEGVVGKRHGSVYESGERSGAWIKHRTNREQEFVIGGYVPGARGIDALLAGVYEGGRLLFVAKVKNGLVARERQEMLPLLTKLATLECPFANLPEKKGARWGEPLTAEKMKACRWVKPELVCRAAFVEWTDAGHLRHCTFIALRDDKIAGEVVRET